MRCGFDGSRREPLSFSRSIITLSLFAALAACTSSSSSPKDGDDDDDSFGIPTRPGNPTPAPTEVPDEITADLLDVSLYVEDYAGIDRVADPVRSGVPIPRSLAIRDEASFRVLDPDGGTVNAQFEVTSRWGGEPDDTTKPIKWVLVSFLADVEASGASTYRFQSSSQLGQGSTPERLPMIATDDAAKVVVDTGAAQFTISKSNFNLFDRVVLANGTVLTSSSPSTGVYLQTADGTRFLASAGVTSVAIEEDGPVETIVVARGKHESAGGSSKLDYTVRLRFWKGRSEAGVTYTFTERDLASIRSYTAVDEVGLEVPADVGANPQFRIGAGTSPKAGALTGEAWQRQTGNLSAAMAAAFDPGNADTINYANGGVANGTGGKAPGWIGASGSNGVVTAALRWYWQQYPKKLRVKPGLLGVELWPSEDVDMRVYAASQKTHEVIFGFYPAGTSVEDAGVNTSARLAHPLMARCNPEWYAKSRVWNRIGIANAETYPQENQLLVERFYENLLEREYPTTFVTRAYDSGGKGHAYSMWDFGDGREDTWSNLAYDTPRSLFIHWAMTGERDLLESGFAAALHLRDVDTEHSEKDTRAGIQGARGVAKPWLGRTRYNPVRGPQSHDLGFEGATGYGFEHAKGQSFADHWLLTGDRMSKDVLAHSYAYYDQWLVDAESDYFRTSGSTRTVSHMLLIVLGYVDAFGTQESMDRAHYIVDYLNDWQRRTSPKDPNGWMWTGSDSDTTSSFQNAVTAESLILYETMFPDGVPVRDNLVDAARWSINPANKLLVNGSQGKYFNAWINESYGVYHASVLDPMMGPMLGYAYGATGERQFADIGSEVMLNSFSQDTSSPVIKAFTQQSRLVPAFFYWLQNEDAQQDIAPPN